MCITLCRNLLLADDIPIFFKKSVSQVRSTEVYVITDYEHNDTAHIMHNEHTDAAGWLMLDR